MPKKTYIEKLRDPRWQKKRLEILKRDDWCCQNCFNTKRTLHIHHRMYFYGPDPWDCPDDNLVTICEDCHSEEKEFRPEYEKHLIGALKKKFLAHDIFSLLHGFSETVLVDKSGIVSSMIEWILLNKEIQKEMVKRYIKYRAETPTKGF